MSKAKGFAVLDDAVLAEISSRGGTAAHAKGVAHEWNKDEAKRAVRKRLPNRPHVPSRKRNGRYEYFFQGKWVSRQRISQLRKAGRLE